MARRLRNLGLGSLALLLASISSHAAEPVHLDRAGERWAAATLRKLTLEEKIGQMIMVWAHIQFLNIQNPEYLHLREEMQRYHVGGFGVTIPTDGPLLLKSAPYEAAYLTNNLQRDSKYPLIFAADFERGLSVRVNGATSFPPAMAFGAAGDPALAREFGRISAQEARAVGIHWNWFPVADVNSNPANPIINTRSFSEDPAQVSSMIDAYIEGARSGGLLTTIKHFPGHGDTDTDSHLALARVTGSMERLNKMELVPFRSAIAAGVDSVMIGHITVPALEPDPNLPASISPHIVTGLLKEQLGFQGIVVTDALDMGALMHVFTGTDAEISGKEAVAAVRAGNDMIIIPADVDGAYNGLLDAVKQGVISKQRIDESALKILRMKASVGLNRTRYVDVAQMDQKIAQPGNVAVAAQVDARAITLALDKPHLLPLRAGQISAEGGAKQASGIVAVLFTEDGRSSEGIRTFVRALREHAPDAQILYVDQSSAGYNSAEVLSAVKQATRVIALAEAVPAPRRTVAGQSKGSVGLEGSAAGVLASIAQTAGDKTVVVAFGNPYLGVGVNGIKTYLCTFSNTPGSATALAGALFGALPLHGRLPVTLPGMAERGAGLDRDAVVVKTK